MKKSLLAVAALFSLSGVAAAADMPVKAPIPTPGCANFGGFYVGGHGAWNGYQTRRNDPNGYTSVGGPQISGTSYTESNNNFGGGVQAGYNFQGPGRCTLWGVEADWSWMNAKTSTDVELGNLVDHGVRSKANWVSTVRGRAGFVVENMLLYLTGGVAFADIQTEFRHTHPVTPFADYVNFSDRRVGGAVGAGIEVALTNNLSLKSEVLYMNFGSWTHSYSAPVVHFGAAPLNQFSFSFNDNVWSSRFGLNYRF
jgi:outer membrane immunogenic protein